MAKLRKIRGPYGGSKQYARKPLAVKLREGMAEQARIHKVLEQKIYSFENSEYFDALMEGKYPTYRDAFWAFIGYVDG